MTSEEVELSLRRLCRATSCTNGTFTTKQVLKEPCYQCAGTGLDLTKEERDEIRDKRNSNITPWEALHYLWDKDVRPPYNVKQVLEAIRELYEP